MAKKTNNNKPKKTNTPNNSNVLVRWLKRIFSAQKISIFFAFLSLIIATVGLYYQCKAHNEASPGNIEIILDPGDVFSPDINHSVNVTGVSDFWGVAVTNYHSFKINDCPSCIRIPDIKNNSDKNLHNFTCEIEINYGKLSPYDTHKCSCIHFTPEDDINCPYGETISINVANWPYLQKDFDVVDSKFDDMMGENKLVYKYNKNIMYCHTTLPFPINEIFLPYKDRFRNNGFDFDFYYTIAYDGIKNPIRFGVHYKVFYDKDHPEGTPQKQYVNKLLNEVYNNNYQRVVGSSYREPGWCLLVNSLEECYRDCEIIYNLKSMSKSDFDSLKYNNIQDLSRPPK